MIKELIKKQIRKTGIVRKLEIDNQNIQKKVNVLMDENKKLKSQISDLDREKEVLLNDLSNNTNYGLRTDLRGMSTDAGKPELLKYILENIKKDVKILDVGFGSSIR